MDIQNFVFKHEMGPPRFSLIVVGITFAIFSTEVENILTFMLPYNGIFFIGHKMSYVACAYMKFVLQNSQALAILASRLSKVNHN